MPRERPDDDAMATTSDELAATIARPPHVDPRPAPPAGTPPRGADHLAVGAVVGRFVVVSELGAGGMGVVYAAYDPELDRKVALKLLRPEFAGGRARSRDEARARFIREAHALARLAHPGVVAGDGDAHA